RRDDAFAFMKSRSAFFMMVSRGMSVWLLLAVVGLSLSGALAPARADDVDDVLKHGVPATAEEVTQIPFHAEATSNMLRYELHNVFRDKAIEGIIIRVEFKDPK